jgi:hypothetical protein
VSRPLSPEPPSVTPALPRHTSTRLHGRCLLLARVTWTAVAVLTVVCIALSIPVEFARLQTVCTSGACQPEALTSANVRELGSMGLSVGFFAGYQIAVELIFAATSFAVGVLIFWRKSDELMAMFVALALVTYGSLAFIDNIDNLDAVAAGYPALWWSFTLVTFMGNIFPVLFFYLFPDGRFVPRWTGVVAILLRWECASTSSPTPPSPDGSPPRPPWFCPCVSLPRLYSPKFTGTGACPVRCSASKPNGWCSEQRRRW